MLLLLLKYRQGVSSSVKLSFLPPADYCHPTMSRKRGEGLCCDPVMHLAACHGQAPPTALKYAQRSITIMLQPCSGHCVVISVASAGFRGATGCSASLSCAASQRSSRCVHTSGGWEAKNRRRRNVAGWKWKTVHREMGNVHRSTFGWSFPLSSFFLLNY